MSTPTQDELDAALDKFLDLCIRLLCQAYAFSSRNPPPSLEALKHEVGEICRRAISMTEPDSGYAYLDVAFRLLYVRVGELLNGRRVGQG